jgi:hypothetical protein
MLTNSPTAPDGPDLRPPGPTAASQLLTHAFRLLDADRVDEALHAAERAAMLARAEDRAALLAGALCVSGAARARMGDDQGLRLLQQGIAAADEASGPTEAALLHGLHATVLWYVGYLAEASDAVTAARRYTTAAGSAAAAASQLCQGLAAAEAYRHGR